MTRETLACTVMGMTTPATYAAHVGHDNAAWLDKNNRGTDEGNGQLSLDQYDLDKLLGLPEDHDGSATVDDSGQHWIWMEGDPYPVNVSGGSHAGA